MAQLPLQIPTADATLTEIVENTRLTNDLIKQNTENSFARAEKFYNRKAVTPSYTEGQTVLLYDENVPLGEMRKLHRFYRPVQIAQCLPHYTYKIRDLKTNKVLPFKISASRLKPLHSSDMTIQDTPRPTDRPQTGPTLGRRPSPAPASAATQVRDRPAQQTGSHALPAPQPRMHNASVRNRLHDRTNDDNWYPITGLLARRRRSDGCFEYRVQYTDNSTAWLPARDIEPTVFRSFNARKRRRRL